MNIQLNYHQHNTLVMYKWRGLRAAIRFYFWPFLMADTTIIAAIKELQRFSMEE